MQSKPINNPYCHDRWYNLVSFRLLAFFAAVFVLVSIENQTAAAVLIGLIFWSLRGPEQSIQALSLSIILKFFNQQLLHVTVLEGALSWGVLLAAAARTLPFYIARSAKKIIPLAAYCIVTGLMATLASANLTLSLMKLLAFFISSSTLIVGFASVSRPALIRLKSWLFSLFTTIFLISLPLYLIPSIGYVTNGRGFQGVLNQPQAFAIFIVPFVAWMIASVLLARTSRPSFRDIAALIVLIGVLLTTKARTATFAALLASAASFLVLFASNYYRSRSRATGKKLIAAAIICTLVAGAAIATSPGVEAAFRAFIFKGEKKEDIGSAFNHSRGAGIESQWGNFLESPFIGHGFGITPGGMDPSRIVYFMGIPISASTEKGFLPTAALEETGAIGFVFFIWLLLFLGRKAYLQYDIRWLAMLFACLFVNIGESVFFSAGGLGSYFWILIALSMEAGRGVKA